MNNGLRIGEVDAIRARRERIIAANPHIAWRLRGERRPVQVPSIQKWPKKKTAQHDRPIRRPRGEPTLTIVKRARKRAWSPEERALVVKMISTVCAMYEIDECEFHSQTRTQVLAEARYTIGWYFKHHHPEWGISAFADLLGRDHTSVMHWLRRAADLWAVQGGWAARYTELEIHMGVPAVMVADIATRIGVSPPNDSSRARAGAGPDGDPNTIRPQEDLP